MRARRLLASCAAVGVGIVLVAPASRAADNLPRAYAGSRITTPASTTAAEPNLSAEWTRNYNPNFRETLTITTTVDEPSGLPAGCDTNLTPDTVSEGGQRDGEFILVSNAPLEITCNGTYDYRILAEYRNPVLGGDEAWLEGTIVVSAPPEGVDGVVATVGDDRTVALTWKPVASPPPDFLGYRVERMKADGTFATIASLDKAAKAFTDPDPIPGGGEYTYRVRSRRASPTGEVLADGDKVKASVPGDSTSTTTPTDPGAGTDGGTAGTDGGGTAGTTAGTTGGAGGGKASPGGGPSAPRNRVGVGVRVPRVGTGQPNIPSLLTAESDDGFSEEIDYGDGLAGEEPGSDDDLASLLYEEDSGRGMAIPVATGFVLAAWAFHLRFLARAARPSR